MRIIIDSRESGTTTGRYIDKLIENLQQVDFKNEYILMLRSNRLETYKDLPNNFHAIECNVKEFTFSEQIKLLSQIKSFKPDLVHFGMVQQPILYHGKVVTTMHDLTTLRFTNKSKNLLVFKTKQFIYKYVNKIVAKKSKVIITPSLYVKKDIVDFAKISPRKIKVTHESADLIKDKPTPIKKLIDKNYIMYVGRHQPHKNLERLIEAHAKLVKDNSNLLLVIAGKKDGVTKILENKIKKSGYKNVIFSGFVSEGQLRWLYENCLAYVFPSLSEGFGLPGLEAMVHGAPVISSNATCLPEIYGDSAIYFNPLDVDDMAKQINRVINSPSIRDELIKKGKKQANKYSWVKMAKETLKIYEKALQS